MPLSRNQFDPFLDKNTHFENSRTLVSRYTNTSLMVFKFILLICFIRSSSANPSINLLDVCQFDVDIRNANAPDDIVLTVIENKYFGGVKFHPLSCVNGSPDCSSEIEKYNSFYSGDRTKTNALVDSQRKSALDAVKRFDADVSEFFARTPVYAREYLAKQAEWDIIFNKARAQIMMIEQVRAALKSGYARCGEKTILAALRVFAARQRIGNYQLYSVELAERERNPGKGNSHQFLFAIPGNKERTYKYLSSLDRTGTIIDLWNGNNGHGFVGSVRDAVRENPGLYAGDQHFDVNITKLNFEPPENMHILPGRVRQLMQRAFDHGAIFKELELRTKSQKQSLHLEHKARNKQTQNFFKHLGNNKQHTCSNRSGKSIRC